MIQNALETIRDGVKKKRQTARILQYLTPAETAILEILIGPNAKILAIGYGQLLEADHEKRLWRMVDAGLACFIKDYSRKVYFIKLYSLQLKQELWEQAIDNSFSISIHENEKSLLTIGASDILFGLNFNHPNDARYFKTAMEKRTIAKPSRQPEDVEYSSIPNPDQLKKSKSFTSTIRAHQRHLFDSAAAAASAATESMRRVGELTNRNVIQPSAHAVGSFIEQAAGQFGKSKKKGIEISEPMHFQHRAHVGWRAGEGFRSSAHAPLGDLDPTIREVLSMIGETPETLDEEEKEFIYDFVDQYGGVEQLRQELCRPKPSVTLPVSENTKLKPPWTKFETRHAPKPPPKPINRPKVPPPPPPPPKPPPLPPLSSLPPARPLSIVTRAPSPEIASLTPPPLPTARPATIAPVKARISFLGERNGGTVRWRPAKIVDQESNEVKEAPKEFPKPEEQGGIAGALARALAERRKRIESDGDSSVDRDYGADYREWD